MGVSIVIRGRTVFARIGATTTTITRCQFDQVLKNSIQALPPFVMFLFSVLLLLPPMEACAPSKPASEAQPSPGQICAQVICCGSDGVTYSTPCSSTCWLPRMPCHWWRRPQPRKPGHCRLDGGRASGLGWSLQENQSGGQQLFNPGCSWHHVRV